MNALTASRRRLAVSTGCLALLCGSLPMPAQAKTGTITFPQSGVICDRGTRICYDRGGISLPLTRREFGNRAEQDLVRKLSGRPSPREFQLSTGEVCDLRRQTCWDDGWRQSNVSYRLSGQLFGLSAGPGRPGNPSWTRANTTNGFCDLSQRGRRIFSGRCELMQRPTASGTAYRVDFRDGRQYSFYNRQGRLVMVDATGTWPVDYSLAGNGGRFRWGSFELLASQSRDGGTNPVRRSSTGVLLQDLINTIFP